jgi:hypothetical protein
MTEANALRFFQSDTEDQQASVAGVHRIALAGPAYAGMAVLARAMLGPAVWVLSQFTCRGCHVVLQGRGA